jgi:Outer membrane efflux protein
MGNTLSRAQVTLRARMRRGGVRACGLVCVVLLAGCSRKYFRERTDNDVVGILTQKNQFPEWAIESFHVYPDSRARFSDPTNPDRPPKPPDDHAAYVLSPNPQPADKKSGAGQWEGTGYLLYLEAWDAQNRSREHAERGTRNGEQKAASSKLHGEEEAQYGPKQEQPKQEQPGAAERKGGTDETFDAVLRTRERAFRITMDQANELALFNSRDFQIRREDLYLAALPVSLERFSFVAQFSATAAAVRQWAGSDAGPDAWTVNTETGFRRLFPSGALLLVHLANQLVVDLTGNARHPEVGISALSLQLAQPLLRGGGYAVTLERLTFAERSLLYAIRSFARFRKLFYVYIAGGTDIFNSPFGLVGLAVRGIGPNLTAPSQGFLPTLLIAAQESNEAQNVVSLQRFWEIFQAYELGGDVSRLQVDQVEQQLLRGRSTLLQRRQDLQTGLDQFKLQLGVPTCLPLELDDQTMQPVAEQLRRFDQVREQFDAVRVELTNYNTAVRRAFEAAGGATLSAFPLEVQLRPKARAFFRNAPVVRGTRFAKTVEQRWRTWELRTNKEIEAELSQLDRLRRELENRQLRLRLEQERPLSPEDDALLTQTRRELYLGRLEAALRAYESRPWLKEKERDPVRLQAALGREIVHQFSQVIGEAREERLEQVRSSWPQLASAHLEGVDLVHDDFDRVLAVSSQYALAHRLELMNARADVVDAWRQIKVQANSLMGVLNVEYNLDTTTPANLNRPLDLGGSRTRQRLTINGELPLVRRAEAIQYRQALIGYQRSRRGLQATEDFILSDVRNDLRQLRSLAENYRIQQRAVEVAYAQVENSIDVLQAPPDPRSLASGGNTAGNAAALTQQLLNAQSSLVQAQNALYTVWVNYSIARMTLYRDLELLSLDARGVWTDDCTSSPSGGQPPGRTLPGPERPGELPPPRPVVDAGSTRAGAQLLAAPPQAQR